MALEGGVGQGIATSFGGEMCCRRAVKRNGGELVRHVEVNFREIGCEFRKWKEVVEDRCWCIVVLSV